MESVLQFKIPVRDVSTDKQHTWDNHQEFYLSENIVIRIP